MKKSFVFMEAELGSVACVVYRYGNDVYVAINKTLHDTEKHLWTEKVLSSSGKKGFFATLASRHSKQVVVLDSL